MTKEQFALITFAIVAALVVFGVLAWRRRKKSQSAIPAPLTVPAGFTGGTCYPVLYVATTRAGDRFDRIAVHELGFRARATIELGTEGMVLSLPTKNVFVPRERIDEVGRANWTIDRVVEPGGLLLLRWRPGSSDAPELETAVRAVGDDTELFAGLQRFTAYQEGATS